MIPGATRAYGTPMTVVRKVARDLARGADRDAEVLFEALDELWDGAHEEKQLVGKVLERLSKRYPEKTLAAVERYVPSLADWANCDNLACFAMESLALADPEGVIERCLRWVTDERKWVRRFGVVVLRAFEHAPAPPGVFRGVDLLRDEEDPDVQKGVTWILRDLTSRHGDAVTKLLRQWASDQTRQRGRMVRDGMKKLPAKGQVELRQLLAG
jgi:3-methyladenine DNA glycosylase AlkD